MIKKNKCRIKYFTDIGYYFSTYLHLNKLSIECQSYQKSRKIDAFEQKIYNVTARYI